MNNHKLTNKIAIVALLLMLIPLHLEATADKIKNKENTPYNKNKEVKLLKLSETQKTTKHTCNKTISKDKMPKKDDTQLVRKPAIYLYPLKKQDTNVGLKLSNIQIKTDIPKYHTKGWNVRAYPNGKLVDLQPQHTDCSKIDSTSFGLEYAKQACIDNNYPYIYWDGIIPIQDLGLHKDGYKIESKKEIKPFLEKRAAEIGFNKKEKQDFVSYWTHALNKENSETFYVIFFQNEEVDKIYKMTIKPKPDNTNRIIMYAIRTPMVFEGITTQKLKKIKRDGFSVVEWGGIIHSESNENLRKIH